MFYILRKKFQVFPKSIISCVIHIVVTVCRKFREHEVDLGFSGIFSMPNFVNIVPWLKIWRHGTQRQHGVLISLLFLQESIGSWSGTSVRTTNAPVHIVCLIIQAIKLYRYENILNSSSYIFFAKKWKNKEDISVYLSSYFVYKTS